ncbi:expressed unknown protein [Ectocarpus siliculosus]|uniref:Uncharacterized protein n=1 Tax=Ectocarpus siliculosus TaxID=2880 RepID=D7FPT8_ECTSI|nr:expressed unknown protein [Ectocarpus siliculosus]|eukprot:CBJ30545.1 expressed unknown protein [Ectocarpus siliculosus]
MTKQNSAAVIILQVVLVASAVAAFVPAPPALRSTTILGEVAQVRNRMERSASYSSGDSSSSGGGRKKTTTTRSGSPAAFGWGTAADARPAAAGTAAWGAKPRKADWSKLFAAPEPEPVQGRPLAVLSRSFAGAAQGSCYSSPLFLGMSLLLSLFSPIVAAQSLVAWGLGRATYWLSMRGEDVSRRMPAGFVGYASLFLVVGGLAFMNGLKGISALRI